MSDKNYEKWSIKDIRKECEKREITLKKGYVMKEVLISFLRENDKKTVIPPENPTKPIFSLPFLEENIEEEYEEKIEERKILIIGSKDKVFGDSNCSFITGLKNEEEDTLNWKKFAIEKSIRHYTFYLIVIVRSELFFKEQTLNFRRTMYILSTLDEYGEIKIVEKEPFSGKLKNYLIRVGYENSSSSKIKRKDEDINIDTFICCGTDVFNRDINSYRSREKYEIKPNLEDYEEPEKVFRKPGKYESISLDLEISKIEQEEKEEVPVITTGITVEEFEKEIEDEAFIKNFRQSILDLLKYKVSFYSKKIAETKKEYTRIKEKVKRLQIEGVDRITIKEMYPMYDFYTGFIIEIENIVEVILQKMSITEDEIKQNLKDIMKNTKFGFPSIVGRENVKNEIINKLYAFSKSYKTFTNFFNNICILGSSGVGKTALAKVIGFVFSKSGILATETVKIVSRSDLVGQYIGQTAPKTKGILLETLEGVLFIDEAYQLSVQDTERDFGHESITEIVNFLDKYIGMNVVIVAGYEDRMNKSFFGSNEGLIRRFPYRLVLSNYSVSELTDILIRFIEFNTINITIDDETANYFYSVVYFISKNHETEKIFINQAGDMLNLGSSIVKTINGSYKIKWKNGNISNNIPLIKEGLQNFLKIKGITCV